MINRVISNQVYRRFLKMGFKNSFSSHFPSAWQGTHITLSVRNKQQHDASSGRDGLKVKCLMFHTHEVNLSKYVFSKQNTCSLVFVNIDVV